MYRLNLEEGRFQESFSSHSPGINKLGISPSHGLVAAAGEEGLLECFDMRQERLAGRFDASTAAGSVRLPISSPFCVCHMLLPSPFLVQQLLLVEIAVISLKHLHIPFCVSTSSWHSDSTVQRFLEFTWTTDMHLPQMRNPLHLVLKVCLMSLSTARSS